ncbi:hypothetical protein UlMin_015545 [Ulmus minor]
MRWHSMGKSKDNDVMRHPVDGKLWQEFDKRHPQFTSDVRNVRLGLAADGFNPFGNMSLSYSMWPVVLTTYNLPPWICMNAEYLMQFSVFESQCKPLGKQSYVEFDNNAWNKTEFYILNNSPELEPYLK